MAMSPKEFREYKDFVSFFYAAGRGNTAKERLSIVFSQKQISRLAKEYHFDARQSYAMISAVQWERLYCYSQTGLDAKRKELIKFSYRKQLKQQSKLKKAAQNQKRTYFPLRNNNACAGDILCQVVYFSGFQSYYFRP